MRELHILPLLAFLLHCSWAEPSRTGRQAGQLSACHVLSGKCTFDDIKKCTHLKTRNGYSNADVTIGKVDVDEWNTFCSKLEELYWINLKIESPNIKSINIPNLRATEGGENQLLEEVSITIFSDTTKYSNFYVKHNPKLKSVKVTTAGSGKFEIPDNGYLWLFDNKVLETIEFPSNAVYGSLSEVDIKGNPLLKKDSIDYFKNLNLNAKEKYIQDVGECLYYGPVKDLTELKVCQYVKRKLELAKILSGSAAGTNLTRVKDNVFLYDPKIEQIDFLYDIRIDGQTFCQFDEEVANLNILYLCNVVKGNLNLTEDVNGSAGNGVLTKVEGNVNLKNAKEKQLGFLKGTDVTGNISSWCLTSLHGKNITKTGPCPADFTTIAPNTTVAPTTTAAPSKLNST